MDRKEAVRIVEKLQEPVEAKENLEGTGLQYPVRVPPEEVYLGEKEHEALELLRFTAKKVEEEWTEETLKITLLQMEMGRRNRLVEKAEKIVKKYEEVVGLIKDSMSQARMHRNDIWLHSIERILTLLTEED